MIDKNTTATVTVEIQGDCYYCGSSEGAIISQKLLSRTVRSPQRIMCQKCFDYSLKFARLSKH